MNATTQKRQQALTAKLSTASLVDSVRAIDRRPVGAVTPELRLVRAWMLDELERRHPEAADAVQAAFEAADAHAATTGEYIEVDYVETLVAALPHWSHWK